jgi:thioredoxin-like negative regulator of GroEL
MILFKNGEAVDQATGAIPLNPMREWLDRHVGSKTSEIDA